LNPHRSYSDSILKYQLTRNLINEKVIINQQPIQIEQASIEYQNNIKIINITVVLEKVLSEKELLLKKKINKRFSSKYQIRMSMKFIL
jgi:predicted RNA methylase